MKTDKWNHLNLSRLFSEITYYSSVMFYLSKVELHKSEWQNPVSVRLKSRLFDRTLTRVRSRFLDLTSNQNITEK